MSLWQDHNWVPHTQLLLNSFAQAVGVDLIERSGSVEDEAQRLFNAPIVVVSHDTQNDPILNYGNGTALDLWQISVSELLRTPSRLTAEPMHREERTRLLERTKRNGFVDDYRGIRITTTGQRFLIEQATVWNLIDESGNPAGQAATFSRWTCLEPRIPQTSIGS
ncbi:MAG: MEKHLA domain-containing protein [Planctomycetaceae bacterium]